MTPTPEREALAELESAFQFTNNRGIAVSAEWINGWEACLSYVRAALTSTTEATAEPVGKERCKWDCDALAIAKENCFIHPEDYPGLIEWLAAQGTQKAEATQAAADPMQQLFSEQKPLPAECSAATAKHHRRLITGTPLAPAQSPEQPAKCSRCGAASAMECNGLGCFALEGQDAPPQAAQAVPTEEQIDTMLAEHDAALTREQRRCVHAAIRSLLAASQQGGRT